MLFSGGPDKRDAAKEGGKKRSTFGLLFGPDIGGSLRPVGESAAHFVRLVATIFASQGLFPRNHPALLGDPKARLTMGMVVAAAWARLEFRRENLHKIALFFTLVGGLVFTALALLFTALALFSGSAHAAGLFDPAGPDDWGENWLNYIFLGQTFTAPGAQATNVLSSDTIQTALKTALALYSNAILVLAGVILLYHLMAMVAETAHSGVPMGKNANQIWAPIRLVVAVALLVPVGTSGLNSGQYIVIQMAKWGSGLASQAWGVFLTAIEDKYKGCRSGGGSPACNGISTNARARGTALIMNFMCKEVYNYYQNAETSFFTRPSTLLFPPEEEVRKIPMTNGAKGYYLGTKLQGEQQLCGGVIEKAQKPNPPNDVIFNKQKDAWDTFAGGAEGAVKQIAKFWQEGTPEHRGAIHGGVMPSNQATFGVLLGTLESNVEKSIRETFDNQQPAPISATTGWVGAGAWFNNIARAHAARLSAMQDSLPQVTLGTTEAGAPPAPASVQKARFKAQVDLKAFQMWLSPEGSPDPLPPMEQTRPTTGPQLPDPQEWAKSMTASGSSWYHPLEWVLGLVNMLAVTFSVWNSDGRLGVVFDPSVNPLAEVAAYGQSNIGLAMGLIEFSAIGLALIEAGTDTAWWDVFKNVPWVGFGANFVVKLASSVLTLATPIAVILFTAGVSIGFLLPLMPFMRFFFGSLTWIIGVFEAVVAAPLLALAHLSPEGAGLAGPAKGGYYFILNIFLRPVLMVFGLIAGFLLFTIAISFLNTMFVAASAGTGAWNAGYGNLAKIIFTVIYCGMVYVCGNNCFKGIGFFPQQALRWLGQSGHQENMGDPNTIATATATAAAYIGEKTFPPLANGPREALANMRKERDEEQSKKTALDRHNALVGKSNLEVAGTDSGPNSREDRQLPAPKPEAGDGADTAGKETGGETRTKQPEGPTASQFAHRSGPGPERVGGAGREKGRGHADGRSPPPNRRTAEAAQNPPVEQERESVDSGKAATRGRSGGSVQSDAHAANGSVQNVRGGEGDVTTTPDSSGDTQTAEQLQHQRQAAQMAADPYLSYLDEGKASHSGPLGASTPSSALEGSGFAHLQPPAPLSDKPATTPPAVAPSGDGEKPASTASTDSSSPEVAAAARFKGDTGAEALALATDTASRFGIVQQDVEILKNKPDPKS